MMRKTLGAVVILGAWLLAAPARAGVYDDVDVAFFPAPLVVSFQPFQSWLGYLRGVAVNPQQANTKNPLKSAHQRQVAALEAKKADGSLTTADRVNLSGSYIRMGRFQDANEVLRGADQTHFLVLANHAAASFGVGEFRQAVDYQEQALKAWPVVWAGWTGPQLKWYQRCERYYLAFLQARARDSARRADGGALPIATVDPIFSRVKFVGPGGRFEAGALAAPMAKQLPDDALMIAAQLVLWEPFDLRLYWLLGEVLNARGQFWGAYGILDDIVRNRNGSGIPELMQHRKVLRQVMDPLMEKDELGLLFPKLLAVAAPRGVLAPVGVGAVCPEICLDQMAWSRHRLEKLALKASLGAPPQPETPAATPPPALPNWRPLTVGFASGIAIAVLVGLQWREWRRRRAGAPGGEAAEVHVSTGPQGAGDESVTRPTPG